MKILQDRSLYWAGSAGAVYSALERLTKREMLEKAESSGATIFKITPEGRSALEQFVQIPVTPQKLIMDPTLLRIKLRAISLVSLPNLADFYQAQLTNLKKAQKIVTDRREGTFGSRMSIELADLATAQLKLEENLVKKLLAEELERQSL